ncbi:MAG TPA: carboxypeptidase-like regulatory domain-containing protein, partial [Sphingomicrobium sp.]
MSRIHRKSQLASSISAVAFALCVCIAQPAQAQLTTSTVRGHVSAGAVPTPGAAVTAVSVETGVVAHATAGPDGSYVLTGLAPGTYDVSVGGAAPQRVIVSVGETATLDLDTAAPPAPAVAAG